MGYAQGTGVTSDRSRSEIEKTLTRFGADQFVYGWDADRALIGFRIDNRMVRMWLPIPDANDAAFRRTPTGRPRTTTAAKEAHDAEVRRRWRSLTLVIKAKLAAVEDGISTIEREFMADIVLPNGQSLGEWAGPQIEDAYASAQMPALMPGA